ncbi:MAG TPA: DUF2232 domain-containing protein [Gammaproteobacteria bacterium]|nr:DUF2232 domain-containing protein [Gammaproteobacteria bacterium]
MKALALYITRDAYKAILVISAFALLGLLGPPLTWIFSVASGAAMTLAAFVWQARQSMLVLIGSTLATAAFALLAAGTATPAILFVISLWLPVWLLVQVYKRTGSLVLALESGVYLAIAAVFLVYASVDDPAAIWIPLLQPFKEMMQEVYPDLPAADIKQLIAMAAHHMTGAVVATVLAGLFVCILLGRSWLALVDKAAPLATDFNGLRFDYVTALISIVLLSVAVMTDAPSALNASIVIGMAYVLPGLAVIHGSAAKAGLSNSWLLGLYILLVFASQVMVPLLSVLGLIDTWVNIRARVKNRAQ